MKLQAKSFTSLHPSKLEGFKVNPKNQYEQIASIFSKSPSKKLDLQRLAIHVKIPSAQFEKKETLFNGKRAKGSECEIDSCPIACQGEKETNNFSKRTKKIRSSFSTAINPCILKKKPLKRQIKKRICTRVLSSSAKSQSQHPFSKQPRPILKKQTITSNLIPPFFQHQYTISDPQISTSNIQDDSNNILHESTNENPSFIKLSHSRTNSNYSQSIFNQKDLPLSALAKSLNEKLSKDSPKKVIIIENLENKNYKESSNLIKKSYKNNVTKFSAQSLSSCDSIDVKSPDSENCIENKDWVALESIVNHGKTSDFVKIFERNYSIVNEAFKSKYLSGLDTKDNAVEEKKIGKIAESETDSTLGSGKNERKSLGTLNKSTIPRLNLMKIKKSKWREQEIGDFYNLDEDFDNFLSGSDSY